MGKGCTSYDRVCVDMTTPPWWREKVVVYYYYKLKANKIIASVFFIKESQITTHIEHVNTNK